MEVVPFAGWNRNARITCGDAEMLVTLEVGPRIISYGFTGERNLMAVHEDTAGQTGGGEFVGYGGHRLWVAPEIEPRTFTPDNGPVEYKMEGDEHVFTADVDRFGIQKQFRITADEARGCFVIKHRIYNKGGYPVELAPWTPTQFAIGGECIFPQARFMPHSDKVLPARPLVLWHYTDMSDERWTWGNHVGRLKWMDKGPTKIGMQVSEGYVAYHLEGNVHLRRFAFVGVANYPDFGCNFETFSRQDMLEVETLSPLQTVDEGAFAEHQETWYLVRDTPPSEDKACGEWLAALAENRPL